MIPAELRPFLPLVVKKLKAQLASQPAGALASQLTVEARAALTPQEQGQLSKVLALAAEQLGV